MKAHERRWPASLAVAVVIGLQFAVPAQIMPAWWPALITVEVLLLLPLIAANPVRLGRDHPALRAFAVALAALLLVVNALRLAQLVVTVTDPKVSAAQLTFSGILIWSTNIVTTAVVFWELDRGGPFARDPAQHRPEQQADLLFPQMGGVPGGDPETWRPSFLDYLFVAFTTATAFSPTDTMPMTGRAKLVTMMTASVSLASIAVIAARAVNIS